VSWDNEGVQLAILYSTEFWQILTLWSQTKNEFKEISAEILGISQSHEIVWSPSGRYIAINASVWVYIIDVENGVVYARLYDEAMTGTGSVLGMVWYGDENLYALYDSPENTQLIDWNIPSQTPRALLTPDERTFPIAIAAAHSGSHLAISYASGSIGFFNRETEQIEAEIVVPELMDKSRYVSNIFWSKNEQVIYGVTDDARLYLWDFESLSLMTSYSLAEHQSLFMRDVRLSPYEGRISVVISPLSRDFSLPMSVERPSRLFLLDGAVQILTPAPSLERLSAIAALCARDATTQTRAVTTLAQPVTTLDALPEFVAQLDALPEGAIPPACAADLRAVATALGD
jgi:WD40 repeat protein